MLLALVSLMLAFPDPESLPIPKSYVCYHAAAPISITGKLDDPAWKAAPWTDDFEDIEGSIKPTPRFRTRAKMIWDDQYLYIGAEIDEPQIWATLTQHDSVIFQDNDFEIFIDPDNDGCFYSEFEMNALNTTWDLLLPRSYRGGGPAIDGFELAGIKTAVHVNGTINDPNAVNHSWTAEVAIPWHAFKDIAGKRLPPVERDQWRINFSRVEWHVDVVDGKFVKRPGLHEDNWVWSPQGVVDMHRPEQWGFLQFTHANSGSVAIDPSPGFRERRFLIKVWEAEQAYHRQNGRYTSLPSELGVSSDGLVIHPGVSQFELLYNGYALDQSLKFSKVGG